MIPGSANPLLLASAAEDGAYAISRSLRFNSSDSAYLSRTPASAGNRKTWTWAGWVKRSSIGQPYADIFNAVDTGNVQDTIGFNNDKFFYYAPSIGTIRTSTAVYRDCAAWYHFVFCLDTTNATAQNRFRLWVNGSEVTTWQDNLTITQNVDLNVNKNSLHLIGAASGYTQPFDGYLADIHFIDGQALDPTSFGEFDGNGVWQAKQYTGTYGTNGFHLDFSDNSTAAALGTDTSSNGNTWTVNNISVTAGAGNDSLVDSPSNGTQTDTGVGGEVVGNYATLNPLSKQADVTLSDGNLNWSVSSSGGEKLALSTLGMRSGKWYCEFTPTAGTANLVGLQNSGDLPITYLGGNANSWSYYQTNGNIYNDNATTPYGSSYDVGDAIGVAFDADIGDLTFYKNGVSQGVAFSSLNTSDTYFFAVGNGGQSLSVAVNFGQRPFTYPAPAGYKALCTANMPDPTIADGSTAMDVALWTGNGSTQTISGLNFSPDLVWAKARSAAYGNVLHDAVRGAGYELVSNLTVAESFGAQYLQSFNSDGFTVGSNSAYNASSTTYVAWTWDAGSSTVSNSDGSITSQVRANVSAGFSVVTYTGTGSLATIGHGLNAAPELIIVKSRSNSENWAVYSKAAGASQRLILNLDVSAALGNEYWNSTDPTSSVFTVNTTGQANGSGQNYVAYCWAPVEGYSAFGSYTGNGSTDGPFVYTGFKPRWIMTKRTDNTGNWTIIDTAREGYNVNNYPLYPNLSNAEGTAGLADILSNGLKLRTNDASVNASNDTYIYAAFAEHPLKTEFIPPATLTFADNTNLGDPIAAGINVVQSDNAAAGTVQSVNPGANQMVVNGTGWKVGEYVETKDPVPVIWKPETSAITSVSADANPVLTFASPNPDLSYFRPGDVVQDPNVQVVSTDITANTMIVDGGSWSGFDGSGDPAGETTVTGPGQQLRTSANLIFDGQGNITGMTTSPVPYVNMDNKVNPQLIFGSDLGTGQPPDTELPAGTSIETTAKAFNTEGESIVSSNVVIPGGTARASGPGVQEDNSQELLAIAASIITHDERVVVHEAKELQNQVQQHQQQLNDLQAQMKKTGH